MILSNIHNIPDAVFQAVIDNVQRPQPDILRVSEMINPPLIKQLVLKHWDTLTSDASEYLWSTLGTSVHAELSGQNRNILPFLESLMQSDIKDVFGKIKQYINSLQNKNILIEKRINASVCGIKLSGMVDRYNIATQTIEDFKVTSVFSYLFGIKEDWIRQLNLYKFLLEQENHVVKNLKIHMILRDHQISKAVQSDYPAIPFVSVDIPVWSAEKINSYIRERVNVHQTDPLPCSPDERWQRDSTWAVMKTGRKSAVRVLDTEDEAIVYLSGNKIKEADKKKCEIVERVGEAIKCKSYCLCRDVCEYNFYKENN